MYKPECEYSAAGHAVFIRGSSELHHSLNVLPPLEVEAVDEEERLLDSRAVEVAVDGQHPAVQSQTTTGGVGGREGGSEVGGRKSAADRWMPDRQSDGQTDGKKDRQTDGQTHQTDR